MLQGGITQSATWLLFLTPLLLIPDPLKRLLSVAGPLQQGIAAGAERVRGAGYAGASPRAARGRWRARAARWSSAT